MLKSCMCSNSGCSVCDVPKSIQPVQADVVVTKTEIKHKFVDFEKLLVTDDKEQLKDILNKDIKHPQ